MNKKEFYTKCSEIVGYETDYVELPPITPSRDRYGNIVQPMTRKTRWGGRSPGNGRFPGLGIIRVFSSQCIHITIKNPDLNSIYNSYDDALDALIELFQQKLEK